MSPTNLLGLDIGEKRIGVARANVVARLPEPLTTLNNDENFRGLLKEIIKQHDIDTIVVGLPRNLDGRETKQSEYVRGFVNSKLQKIGPAITYQDETLSTVEALERIKLQKKPIDDVDSLAAAVILEDYLNSGEV
ncbi:Holliday junction resolvase RuvX [Candidatus Saccharibacteria bacterium]|jgi:putative Holliday junction resolvase|nr:Holliday junction resolvase RuvX [Candidatus Saccharibacteria bacterium]HOR23545.1 Holliday junction resolvase RuvX [Candidatus Saccharibacteria bacterium]